jgi:hypothetical protein
LPCELARSQGELMTEIVGLIDVITSKRRLPDPQSWRSHDAEAAMFD